MKRIFICRYGDDSRVLIVSAKTQQDAIAFANNYILKADYDDDEEEREEDEDCFIFDEDSVSEADLNTEGVIDEFNINFHF